MHTALFASYILERRRSPLLPPHHTRPSPAEYLKLADLRDALAPRESPFVSDDNAGGGFVGDRDLVQLAIMQYESPASSGAACQGLYDAAAGACVPLPPYAVRSGPRRTVYHDPAAVTAAVVTCGGLCPGLNDVVQNVVYQLADYGVPEDQIFGIRYGLRGFLDRHAKPIPLSRAAVDGIQLRGGTVLGTSRGGARVRDIVERLRLWGINMLFVIGGNGGNAAAHAIARECRAAGVLCNVVGVPKSIDNDIQLIDRCFGFDTAVEEAQRSLVCARVEARAAAGITVVKLMGRQSGFIAMNASMASGVVDVCLIPEVPFALPRLLAHVRSLLAAKDHCVICCAEGAGQDLVAPGAAGHSGATDASGNPILEDIGVFLRDALRAEFAGVDVKYIDPSAPYYLMLSFHSLAARLHCIRCSIFMLYRLIIYSLLSGIHYQALPPPHRPSPAPPPSPARPARLHDPLDPDDHDRPHLLQGPRPGRGPRRLCRLHRLHGRPRQHALRLPPDDDDCLLGAHGRPGRAAVEPAQDRDQPAGPRVSARRRCRRGGGAVCMYVCMYASALRGAAQARPFAFFVPSSLLTPSRARDVTLFRRVGACAWLQLANAVNGALCADAAGFRFQSAGERRERSLRARRRRVAGLVQLPVELWTGLGRGRAHVLAGLRGARAQREERGCRDARGLEGAENHGDARGQRGRQRVGVERRDVVAGEAELGELRGECGEERAGADVALAGARVRARSEGGRGRSRL
jgi:6-phosphofructokinase 1